MLISAFSVLPLSLVFSNSLWLFSQPPTQVWVNTWLHRDLRTSFGGTKDSGVGREGGNYSLDFYSETKNMCLALGQKAPPMPGNMSRP